MISRLKLLFWNCSITHTIEKMVVISEENIKSKAFCTQLIIRVRLFRIFMKSIILVETLMLLHSIYYKNYMHVILYCVLAPQITITANIIDQYSPHDIMSNEITQFFIHRVLNYSGCICIMSMSLLEIPRVVLGTSSSLGAYFALGMFGFLYFQNFYLILINQLFCLMCCVYAKAQDPNMWLSLKFLVPEHGNEYLNPRGLNNILTVVEYYLIVMLCGHFMHNIYMHSVNETVSLMYTKDQFVAKVSHDIRTPLK